MSNAAFKKAVLQEGPKIAEAASGAVKRKLDQVGKPDMSPPQPTFIQPRTQYPATVTGLPNENPMVPEKTSSDPPEYEKEESPPSYPQPRRLKKDYVTVPVGSTSINNESAPSDATVIQQKAPPQTIRGKDIYYVFLGLFLVGIIVLAALAGTGVITCKASYRGYSGGSSDNPQCCKKGGNSCESGNTKTNS